MWYSKVSGVDLVSDILLPTFRGYHVFSSGERAMLRLSTNLWQGTILYWHDMGIYVFFRTIASASNCSAVGTCQGHIAVQVFCPS